MKLKNKTLAILAGSLAVGLVTGSDIKIEVNGNVQADSEARTAITEKVFTDVTGQSRTDNAINSLYAEGYLQYGDGTFKPSQTMTLQSFAYLFHSTGLLGDVQVKTDLKANPNIYAGYVTAMVNAGLLPKLDVMDEQVMKKEITQDALASVLVKVFDLQGETLEDALVSNGIVPLENYVGAMTPTRADFALQLYNAISVDSELEQVKDSLNITSMGFSVESKNASASMIEPKERKAVEPKTFKHAVASATPVMASTATVAKPFKDVSKNSSYYKVIHEMRDMGIINGYADNTFKPSEPINRQNGAAMISRYTPVKYGGTAKFPTLSDVTTKNANYNALVQFQKTGIYSVAKDGKVYPTKAMTRGEMAKAITLAFGLKVDANATTKLKDVPKSLKPYVAAIEKAEITTGYEDSTFRPAQTLTRAHFAVFMHRAIEYKEQQETIVEKPVTPPVKPVTPPTEVNTKPFDLKPTDIKVLDSYSPRLEDVSTTPPPLPNMHGMERHKFIDHQGEIFTEYKAKNDWGTLVYYTIEELKDPFYGDDAVNKSKLGRDQFYQALNYVQRTGEIYKGEHFVMYFQNAIRSDGKQHFFIAFKTVYDL